MTNLYVQQERQRAEHERRLEKQRLQPLLLHDFSRPEHLAAGVEMVRDALARPHDLTALLTGGGRGRNARAIAPAAPPARKEHDFNRPADRDAARPQGRASTRRSRS